MNTRFKPGDKFKFSIFATLIRPLDTEQPVLMKDGTIQVINNPRGNKWFADMPGCNHPILVCLDSEDTFEKMDDYYQEKPRDYQPFQST